MKRLIDILFSFLGIITLLPLGVIVSLLIVVDSGYPVFFIQNRVGQYGKVFRLLKFRTMHKNKKSHLGSFDAGDSSRVTTVGAFLRKMKLDELPQLINVLKGDMSLVGPRPEVEKWVAEYPERWAIVLSVKPGITDNASIEFRNEEEILKQSADPQESYKNEILPRKLSLYEQYVEQKTIIKDFRILMKTVIAICSK